ncbi:dTDP-glucose 4,6-dehydratase [Devosia algicola]|uniref:dTDP-glucose 4,6-dehydratase n=1 Tax=Devosia algicola TaxID=3026418 RepID=A0ABY7YNQ7_9HYPH|nr:dTDP-glucose 4,6-dehydratase [Devosia algicola]WDR02945.1 dTDP-glucose 4,6-dehydratase [Devosia algicola]
MTILVTGGAGFIGSNFIRDWIDLVNEPVINLDKLTYAGNLDNLRHVEASPRYTFVQGDILDTDRVRSLLAGHEVRAIVHFAAESHVDRSITGPDQFVQTNVVGTAQLLQAALERWQHGQNIRFLHVSTDEVFGSLEPDDPPFVESSPYLPNSPYAASKAASDHLVRAYGQTYGLPVLTTHCSNNYGPHHFPEKLIPLLIHNATSGKDLPLYGDGRQVRDWLYVSDHCRALRLVLADGQPGTTYNIGGNAERQNIEVARTVCAALDRQQPLERGRSYSDQIVLVRDRPGHDRRYAINSTKLRNELGWAPLENFDDGIGKTVQWYLSHPGWVEAITSGTYRDWIARQYS